MKQISLHCSGFEVRSKKRRKRELLVEMNQVVPWSALVALIESVYPSRGDQGGRQAFSIEAMFRIHFLHQWFCLSGPAMEGALDDMAVFQ